MIGQQAGLLVLEIVLLNKAVIAIPQKQSASIGLLWAEPDVQKDGIRRDLGGTCNLTPLDLQVLTGFRVDSMIVIA